MGTFDTRTTAQLITFTNDNTALVQRKGQTGTSPTNEPIMGTSTVYASLPCGIQPLDVKSAESGNLEVTIEGNTYLATHVLTIGAISGSDIAGHNAGDTVTVSGVNYIVSANKRAGFVDVQANDKLTDESGATYLVLGVVECYDILPHLEARVAFGKAWA